MTALPVRPLGWRREWLWVALFAILTTFAFLGLRGIWDPDEGRYTNVALNMLESGDWLIPRRSDEVGHWTKPPLTYWAIAASVWALGSTAFAARLPSALAHLLCVLLVARIGHRLLPGHGARAALVYAAMLFPFGAAQYVSTDYVLTAVETLAMWAYVEARFGARRPRAWLVLAWAGFGLAFLAKGPPGLLPLLPLVVFELLTRDRERPSLFQPLGMLAFLAIALPWYIVVTQRTPGLLGYFLGDEVIGRIASDEFRRHGEWYGWLLVYAPTLLLGTLPWSRTLWRWMAALPARIASLRGDRARRMADAPWLLVAAWVLVPLLLFCLSRSRLPLYILPLWAPIALAITLQSVGDDRALPRWPALLAWGGLMLALAFAAARFPTDKDARTWIRAMRERAPGPIAEVLFVDDMARYGVHLHAGVHVEVEKLALRPAPNPARFNPEYDETMAGELREHESAQLWVVKQENWQAAVATARREGFEPVPQGTPYRGRIFFRTERRWVRPSVAPPAH